MSAAIGHSIPARMSIQSNKPPATLSFTSMMNIHRKAATVAATADIGMLTLRTPA